VEDAVEIPVTHGAAVLRAIVLELERLYNHVADIGALCNDVGFGIVQSHALRIREQLLRINKHVTGHRLLRGAVTPGGARVTALVAPAILRAIAADVHEVVDIALANSTVVDRFTGTAVLSQEHAQLMGALGVVARASGIAADARQVDPFARLYDDLRVPVHEHGDVLSRFRVRVEEIDASIALLSRLLDRAAPAESLDNVTFLPPSPPSPPPPSPAETFGGRRPSGVGVVEGWRGTIVHRVELAPNGSLSRVKVVDPSFFNWPALPVALADTIVPDFPLANKSFNLSYAANDL
jgi:Ni,Fe-hydrogenase III large subunit